MRARGATRAGTAAAAAARAARGSSRGGDRAAPRSSRGSRAKRSRSQRSTNTRPRLPRARRQRQRCARCRRASGRGTRQPSAKRLDRAVAGPRRDQRDDGGAAGEGDVDRAQQPRVLLGGGHERRRDRAGRRAARRRDRRSASAALREVVERHPLVQPLERLGVRGLEPHRDLELRRSRPRIAHDGRARRGTDRPAARPARDAIRRSPATTRRAPPATPS